MKQVKNIKLPYIEEGLMVKDEKKPANAYVGGSQLWLSTQNGQLGGCGTATGANILAYLAMTQTNLRPLYGYPDLKHSHFKQHMEDVYEVLKPMSLEPVHNRLPEWLREKLVPSLGIPGIAFFSKRLCRFAAKKGIHLNPVWRDQKKRPAYNTNLHLTMGRAVEYIEQGLASGCPVAMLNGLNPGLRNIQYTRSDQTPALATGNFQRHWVAITGICQDLITENTELQVASWGYETTLILQDFWGKGYTAFIYFTDASSGAGLTDH